MHTESLSRQAKSAAIFLLLACHMTDIHGNSDIQEKTYQHTINGVVLTCNKCPPGTHILRHCNVDGGYANCAACVAGETYNTDYNIARSCAHCSMNCRTPQREDLVKNCTPTANISCHCKSGYYRMSVSFDPLCLEIDACPAGKGVVAQGDGFSNTECETCRVGETFSNTSSKTAPCQPCTPCLEGFIMKRGSCGPVNATKCVTAYRKEGLSHVEVAAIVMGCIVVTVLIVMLMLVCTLTNWGRRMRYQVLHCQRNYGPCENHAPSSEHEKRKPMQNGTTTYDNEVKVALSNDMVHHEQNVGSDRHHGNSVPTTPQHPEQSSCISDKHFYELREDLVSLDYPQFFRFLFEDGADKHIQEIKIDYQSLGVKEIIYQLLVKWREVEKENASPDKIISALKDWERQDLVDKYRAYFALSDVQTSPLSDTRNSSTSTVSYSKSNAGSISTDV